MGSDSGEEAGPPVDEEGQAERDHFKDGRSGIGRDLRSLLGVAVEATPTGIMICAAEGQDHPIIYVNPAFTRITGYAFADVQGRDARFLQGPGTDPASVARLRAGIAAGQVTEVEVLNYRKDGSRFWNEVQVVPIRGRYGLSHFLGLVTDVTQRRETEERLNQAVKMEAIGKLTGGIAHDFNNLLAVILGNLQLIQRHAGNAERVNKLCASAIDAVSRATGLVKELLAFARRQSLEPRPLVVNELVANLIPILRRTLGEDITVREDMAPDLWPVAIDEAKLEAAVYNLATNARDAMKGGDELTFITRNVVIDDADALDGGDLSAGDYVSLTVRDTGCGIPAEVLPRVFEPFFTTKEVGQGSGLGLSMVYGFVTQSGGSIKIDSKLGAGTEVRMLFTRAHLRPASTTVAVDHRPATGSATVLLVEDNPLVRQTLENLLVDMGFAVLSAVDAESAKASLLAGPVDVLLSDVVMPGGASGVDLARWTQLNCPGVAIVLTSGYPGTSFSDIGEFPMVPKPATVDSLLNAFAEALSRVARGEGG